jgi:glutaredoxin-like protein NrdH
MQGLDTFPVRRRGILLSDALVVTAAARIHERSSPMQVKVFALSTCPYCRMTREYMDDNGVAFDVTEVDKLEGQERDDAIAEVKRLSGGTSFPVVVIDDEVVVGFNKVRIKELLGL